MKNIGTIYLVGLLFLLGCSPVEEIKHPNIVFILADDLGYGDLQCYNSMSLISTPNLNRLANEGIRMTKAYCPVSVCSPTRYSLMTGRYSWRSWKKTGVMANYEPSMMDTALITLPEMLQSSGYITAGFGKWHLGASFPTLDGNQPAGYGKFRADDNGANLDLTRPVNDGPLDHGFDHWLGFSCASECWILDGNNITGAIGHDLYTIEATPNKDHIEVIPLQDYLPYITNMTLDFLHKQNGTDKNEPFFLYFSPYVPHIPLAVGQEFIGKTKAGLYGDYVHELDYYIGRLLNRLDSLGLTENTLVFFASDNGSQFLVTSDELDLRKATNDPNDSISESNLSNIHNPNWPLRGNKWSIYEGGVRTPFIARWPDHFPKGEEGNAMFGLNDMMVTLAALINYDLPPDRAFDSYNVLPLLQGENKFVREEIVVQSSGRKFGIIKDKWKYIAGEEPELFDLELDQKERVNVYDQYPEIASELLKKLEEIMGEDIHLLSINN